jgi:large conductance mechanosensitive channel
MFKEFRDFINRGNVLDLAVAVIIGAAFGKIVTSLTDDVIMPIVGKLFGGLDFSGYFLKLGPVPANYSGSLTDYAALKKAGVPLLGYGEFITQAVNFLIVAFIIFLIVRAVNRAISATSSVSGRNRIRARRDRRGEPLELGDVRGEAAASCARERQPGISASVARHLADADVARLFKLLEMLGKHRIAHFQCVANRRELHLVGGRQDRADLKPERCVDDR